MASRVTSELLLVGSLPAGSTEEALRAAGELFGDLVFALPDGETGPRALWAAYEYYRLVEPNPQVKVVDPGRVPPRHPDEEIRGSHPQDQHGEPGHERGAQGERSRGAPDDRRDDVFALVDGRVQQHREQHAAVRPGVEPCQDDGQRSHLEQEHGKRLCRRVVARDEELGQVPAGPDRAEQHATPP